MKSKMVMVITGVIILALLNYAIWQKQQHLNEGEEIFLKLAPVDPRSLMQGDYMALRFELSNHISEALYGNNQSINNNELAAFSTQNKVAEDGFVVVILDENKVAKFVRIDDKQMLTVNQRKLQFRVRNNQVKFATNAFFFAEGDEPLYRNAQFGVFRLNGSGEVLLTGMLGGKFQRLGQ